MKPSTTHYSTAEARKLKHLVEERTLSLDLLSSEDAALCKPHLHDLLPAPVASNEALVSYAEAIWLPMAAEMIRSNYSRQNVFMFSYTLLGRFLVPPGQKQIEVDGHVLNEDTLRLLDQFVGYVLTEKQDVVLQFTRDGEFGFVAGTDTSKAIANTNSLSFSVHRLINETVDKQLALEEQRLEKLSDAETALLDTARDPRIPEFKVIKAAAGKSYRWDLVTTKTGMVKAKELHELTHKSTKSHGDFKFESKNNGRFYFTQKLRQRF